MTYEITPQVGFGPIKFGAAPEEIQDILGKPSKVEKSRIFDETDEDEIKLYKNYHYEWYGEKFPNSKFPQITFDYNKVVGITIFKQSGPLIYREMDLHKVKKRQEVLEALAKDEDVYYYDEGGYFFPKSGLTVPIPKFAKRNFYVMLNLTTHMMPRLEFEMYEPSTALD